MHWSGFWCLEGSLLGALTLALNVLVLIIGLAYLAGQWREKMQLRDWRQWRDDLEQWRIQHEREAERHHDEIERRFDDASRQMSKISSMVQVLPTQIEDRVAARFYEARVAEKSVGELERRMTAQEERCSRLHSSRN